VVCRCRASDELILLAHVDVLYAETISHADIQMPVWFLVASGFVKAIRRISSSSSSSSSSK
jgi:hypothetical protein